MPKKPAKPGRKGGKPSTKAKPGKKAGAKKAAKGEGASAPSFLRPLHVAPGSLTEKIITLAKLSGQSRDEALNVRQLAILLICYTQRTPQTVQGLSRHLEISKPSVSRNLSTMVAQGLLAKQVVADDQRLIITRHTAAGAALVRQLGEPLASESAPSAARRVQDDEGAARHRNVKRPVKRPAGTTLPALPSEESGEKETGTLDTAAGGAENGSDGTIEGDEPEMLNASASGQQSEAA